MNQEGFCERHGPYDARLGSCPYCGRQSFGRPQPPPTLWDDEEATDPWAGRSGNTTIFEDDIEETDPRAGRTLYDDELEETNIPRRFNRPGFKPDDVEETVIDRPAKSGLLGWLIIKDGSRRGKIFEVRDGVTVGRQQADVMVHDPKMSRPHAKFKVAEQKFELWDLASENGTFVNGEAIRGATLLQENDEIKMGDTIFVLKTLP